jgi:hypothetical protein
VLFARIADQPHAFSESADWVGGRDCRSLGLVGQELGPGG